MDVKYLITCDASGAIKAMKEFNDSLDNTAKESDKAEKASGGLWKQVALGSLAYDAAKKAGRFFVDFLKESAEAAMDAERKDKALAAALEITGRPVQAMSEHLKTFATEMQRSTTFEDEAVKGAQALLVQLTDLDQDGLDRATKGAIGLASVMGMDLQSAASLVAKAMSGNEAALSRYGIRVDETLTAEGKRAQLMEKLESFYGRATAETETFGGQLAQLDNTFGELKESIGGFIIQSGVVQNAMRAISETMQDLMTYGDALDASIRRENETTMNSITRFREAANAVHLTGEEVRALSAKFRDVDDVGIRHEKMLRDLIKSHPELKEELHKQARAAQEAFEKEQVLTRGTNKYSDEVKDATKKQKTFNEIVYDMPGAMRASGQAMTSILPTLGQLDAGVNKIAIDWSIMTKKSVDFGLWWSDQTKETFNQVKDSAISITGEVGNLFQALTDRKLDTLTREYERQKYIIEQSKMSEEEKFIALSKLEEEYNTKADGIRKAGAKKQKQIQYAMAVMDAAGAIVNALNTHPFIPAGLIAAATAAVMGGIQVATIASTPLAKGAIFDKPTIIPALNGRVYEAGEAGTEVVASVENLRRVVGVDERKGGSARITLINKIYLDGREMKEFITGTVAEASRTGSLKIAPKAIRE